MRSVFVEIFFQSTVNLGKDVRFVFFDEIIVTNIIEEIPAFRLIVGFHSFN